VDRRATTIHDEQLFNLARAIGGYCFRSIPTPSLAPNGGDSGRVYFWILEHDLAACRFDRTWHIMQCS
jgi:hypothetical protein